MLWLANLALGGGTGAAVAATSTAQTGRSRRRYVVEVDGQDFIANTIQEAQQYLELARSIAEREYVESPEIDVRTESGRKTQSRKLKAAAAAAKKAAEAYRAKLKVDIDGIEFTLNSDKSINEAYHAARELLESGESLLVVQGKDISEDRSVLQTLVQWLSDQRKSKKVKLARLAKIKRKQKKPKLAKVAKERGPDIDREISRLMLEKLALEEEDQLLIALLVA